MSLFNHGEFVLHSGESTNWKLDCDALSDDDIRAIAAIVGPIIYFSSIVGVPRGGTRLAAALSPYCRDAGWATLIVDDVLTTGRSMEQARGKITGKAKGFVIFARGPMPKWVQCFLRTKGTWAHPAPRARA